MSVLHKMTQLSDRQDFTRRQVKIAAAKLFALTLFVFCGTVLRIGRAVSVA